MTQDEVWAVGLDVGGTKIAGGLVRFPAGEVESRQVIPTRPERGAGAVLADLAALARRLLAEARSAGRTVGGVGVGVPELVDLDGRITSGQTIDWRGVDLADRLGVPVPVRVDADVRAAALAEARFGAGRPHRVFVYVTVGTGISSTLVQDGVPYAGARGNALVLGSGPMTTACHRCGAITGDSLEGLASGPGLVRRFNRLRPSGATRAEEVLALAEAGDAGAARVVREGGEALGLAVAFLVNVLDPEAVVVGGGLGLAGGAYGDAFVDSVRRHVWAEASRGLPLLRAELGADAGLIGAAAVVERAPRRATEPGVG